MWGKSKACEKKENPFQRTFCAMFTRDIQEEHDVCLKVQ